MAGGKSMSMSRPPRWRGLMVRVAWWALAMAATMDSPRPRPSPSAGRVVGSRWNGWSSRWLPAGPIFQGCLLRSVALARAWQRAWHGRSQPVGGYWRCARDRFRDVAKVMSRPACGRRLPSSSVADDAPTVARLLGAALTTRGSIPAFGSLRSGCVCVCCLSLSWVCCWVEATEQAALGAAWAERRRAGTWVEVMATGLTRQRRRGLLALRVPYAWRVTASPRLPRRLDTASAMNRVRAASHCTDLTCPCGQPRCTRATRWP